MIMRSFLTLVLLVTLSAPAAAGINDAIEKKGQYWQRINTSSALYLRGPKAQQMLNRDISRCVVELRELERLGAVRNAIPHYAEGLVMSEDEAELAGYDTPERDKELFAEHGDYIDFEGCMMAKGWERVKYVPYDVAGQAQENYRMTHTGYREQERINRYSKYNTSGGSSGGRSGGDYDHLND